MGTRRIHRDDGDYTLFFRKVSPFSNHHPAEFDCDESLNFRETKRFSCTEQYYMYNKASLLKDRQLMDDVLSSDNPKEMKSMCSKGALRNWCEYTWNEHKENVMYTGCKAKFRACKHLRYVLFLSTGSELVECSPFDRIWGIGKDLETAMTTSVRSGQNLLGKILDRVREELWNDRDYRDERNEVESRMRKDGNYLIKAMEHIDLMYKGRATQRYLLSQRHIYRDNQAYVSSDILSLIPEWAVPPKLEKNEPITTSPPQFINFKNAPPLLRPRSSSPVRKHSGRLAGRITYSEVRPGRVEIRDRRRTRSRSRSSHERKRNRSRSNQKRKRRRSRSRHEKKRRRSRSGHRTRERPTSSLHSEQRESKNRERSPHRKRERSQSRDDRKRRRSRSYDRDRKQRRTRSRSSHRSKRDRSRSRSHSRERRQQHLSRPELPEEENQEDKQVKRRKLRSNKSRSRERSDSVRESRSESQEECHQRLKKMRKLLKRRAKEKRQRALKPPSSTSSESEAEKPSGRIVEIASESSSSPSNVSSVLLS